ncbi:DNA translocase FtsK [Clostridium rectalis]|uniref:DNA translocase FtsK n=1 Tax=Clostridium rectalis TaxID=2040295 RepID=UPI000F6303E2|nr:DNA translocase FtsK [Clostridium rectalis]
MENLKIQAISIFKKYPENINIDLLRRHLKIGLVKANKLMDLLEKEGFVSEYDKNGKRELIIK